MASVHKHFRKECKPVFMEYRFSFRRFGFWFSHKQKPVTIQERELFFIWCRQDKLYYWDKFQQLENRFILVFST